MKPPPDFGKPPAMPIRRDYRIGILGSGFIVNECHLVSYRKCGFNSGGHRLPHRARERPRKLPTATASPAPL